MPQDTPSPSDTFQRVGTRLQSYFAPLYACGLQRARKPRAFSWLVRAYLVSALATAVTAPVAAAPGGGGPGVCSSDFLGSLIPFIITAGATLLIAAVIAAALFGGAGQAASPSSQKREQYSRMQTGGLKAFGFAFGILAVIGIGLAWVTVPIDTSCMPGIDGGGGGGGGG